MKNRKNVKKEARQVLKKNYYRIIAVSFFIMVALGTIHIFKSRITIPSFSIRRIILSKASKFSVGSPSNSI